MNFPPLSRRRNNNNHVGGGGGNGNGNGGQFGGGFLRLYHIGFFVAVMFAVLSMWTSQINILYPSSSSEQEQGRVIQIATNKQDSTTYQPPKDAIVEQPPAIPAVVPMPIPSEVEAIDEDAARDRTDVGITPTTDKVNEVVDADDESKQTEDRVDETTTYTEQKQPPPQPQPEKKNLKPNLLFIVCDQLRWDAIGVVQRTLKAYRPHLKIRTPNIDRLVESGVWFKNAYCGAPSCAPSRAVFRTGNSLQRAAIKGNKMIQDAVWKVMPSVREKVLDLETFEQLLHDKMGYSIKTFGKWHVPNPFYKSKTDPAKRIIESNYLDFSDGQLKFRQAQSFKPLYQTQLNFLLKQDQLQFTYQNGQQKNPVTKRPYWPGLLDPRRGRATNTPLTSPKFLLGNSNILGRDALPAKYTTTSVLAKMGLRALDLMMANIDEKPFCLSMHFNAPHPPMVATSVYLDYYYNQRGKIFVPPSIKDNLLNTPYQTANLRQRLLSAGIRYDNEPNIAELTAYYYAMIEEVDAWLGIFMNKLKNAAIDDNTLVVFTSDHGEMLGAHGLKGKGVLLEEATKVPLTMSFPGKIPPNSTVGAPVSHIDLFATILDYLEVPKEHEKSDGRTLKRFISNNLNNYYEERYAVVELDGRRPLGPNKLSGKLGGIPNFAIRKGRWKLIITKKRDAEIEDMLYDLRADPYETRNKLGNKGMKAQTYVIGKAEHLKCLLVEWMNRNSGPQDLYTAPRWNLGEGEGDIAEIRARRTWRSVSYWQSDGLLSFGRPITKPPDGLYRRNEFIYVGRTTAGQLQIPSITVEGPHKDSFTVTPKSAKVNQGEHIRIKVQYRGSRKTVKGLKARVVIKNNVNGVSTIPIYGER